MAKSLREKLVHEVRELIPVTLFFFVAFQLLVFTQALMLEQYGIRVWSFMAATVGALIVAEVVIIADHFSFVNRYPHKPLVYNIAWKTGIYFVGSILVRYGEQHIVHFWQQAGGFAETNRRMVDEVVWAHALGMQIGLLVLLLVCCSCRELIGAVGRDRLMDLLLGGGRGNSSPANH